MNIEFPSYFNYRPIQIGIKIRPGPALFHLAGSEDNYGNEEQELEKVAQEMDKSKVPGKRKCISFLVPLQVIPKA